MNKNIVRAILYAGLLLITPAAYAQIIALDEGMQIGEKRTGWLPYAFSTEALGTAVGVAAFSTGSYQYQTSFLATALATSNESALISGAMSNVRLGGSRFLVDSFVLLNHFTDQRFYAGFNPAPGDVRSGSNDSREDDYLTGVSNEVTFNLTVKYRLPLGGIKDDPVAVYRLRDGLLESGPVGGERWDPWTSGQTTLGGNFFYTYRDLSDFTVNTSGQNVPDEGLIAETNGLELWLEYDNTDFPSNPARGSRQLFKISRDFGWGNSSNSWTNIEADLSKYLDLGSSRWFRQRVVALNFWTSNTTTWKTDPSNPNVISNRPPPGYGSRLGGFDRLRAYPSGRFSDKAAAYYAAELRLIPQIQPLRNLPVLRYFEIDWWQVVPFVEAGRAGPEFDSDLFFKDLKWSAGIGIRLMAFRLPVRLDFAVSEEGPSFWAMFAQPFSRQGN